ncbi:transcriptional regulator, LysR family [Litoreibacter ascidiaceicola]|uniref:Transcriptional regulator, LysR family n=1 Tax=Litoreibacter ascidiaceicola TaxID=1486859 RepID=A0A1M4UXG9_9RHOB|nr:LysR family transcriptional regulator [Litoreibacter ascidiaceicola]SHE61333.1 transcriptional regulator, LysR family [Litoreibacter ascidiaceicola]
MLIENLKLFLKIVEKGGLAAAGREVGLSPATVTDRLAALEAHYGARLLTRTTRSLSLTDEGRELVTGARRILAETEETEARIKLGVEKISGRIHVSAPNDLGRSQIVPLLDSFMLQHPEIAVDLTLSDGYIDLVGRGIDLALRYGELSDSTMKSRKLGPNQRLICASPDYLKRNGVPRHPDDLDHHNCLIMRFGSSTDQDWVFVVDGKQRTCRVQGNRIADGGDVIRQWCLNGLGVALKSEWDVRHDLAAGTLVTLLDAFSPNPNALQMVYPAGVVQPRRVRALMDYLSKTLDP